MFEALSTFARHPVNSYDNEMFNNIRYTQLCIRHNNLLHLNKKYKRVIDKLYDTNKILREENERLHRAYERERRANEKATMMAIVMENANDNTQEDFTLV